MQRLIDTCDDRTWRSARDLANVRMLLHLGVRAQELVQLTVQGVPALRGEIVEGDVAGYHCYPSRGRVIAWFSAAGLAILDEGFRQEVGWGYRHFLLQALGGAS